MLPLLAITFAVTSCSKSEPENLPEAGSIYGDIPTVHVAQAGTLEAILTEKGLLETTALKITGVLNDNDIDTFKSMITGTLRTLDISEAEVPNTFDLEKSLIEKIALPNAWTAISDDFLYRSEDLMSVVIGNNVEKIGTQAFGYCSSLASINIPEGVTSIGGSAFNACTSLSSITIPEGVTSIGGWAFFRCTSLTSINIPESVTSIGQSAFVGCISLKNINIAAGNTQYVSENGAVFSKDKSQLICCPAANGSYTIPEGVTSIGEAAFYNCNGLTSITIPEGVTSIGENTFWYCSSLTSITIPESVTSIGGSAFQNCSSLTSITIPEGVTSIGDYAFYNCNSLASINIPEGVTSIGEDAFYNCNNLANVTCLAAIPPAIGDSNFSNFSTDVLHVPSGSVAAYKADAVWSDCFSDIVAIAE